MWSSDESNELITFIFNLMILITINATNLIELCCKQISINHKHISNKKEYVLLKYDRKSYFRVKSFHRKQEYIFWLF